MVFFGTLWYYFVYCGITIVHYGLIIVYYHVYILHYGFYHRKIWSFEVHYGIIIEFQEFTNWLMQFFVQENCGSHYNGENMKHPGKSQP